MNDSEAPPVDWPKVLARARRRLAFRLVMVSTIAALGTLLLLGGGLNASGAVSWIDRADKSGKEKAKPKPAKDGNHQARDRHSGGRRDHRQSSNRHPRKQGIGGHNRRKCSKAAGDSAGEQYRDCPPDATGEDEGKDGADDGPETSVPSVVK